METGMSKVTVADALSLSVPERIVLVEQIWDSIAADADAIDLTDADKQIIDQRLAAHRRNPDAVSPWPDVYQRIVEKG